MDAVAPGGPVHARGRPGVGRGGGGPRRRCRRPGEQRFRDPVRPDRAPLSYDDWSFTIRNELDIVFLVTQAAWPQLRDGGGSIVNIASISATRGAFFMPQNAHGAAKGGVLALTYQLAVEGGPQGIRVNAVSPAMTETPHTAAMLHDPAGPAGRIAERTPLGRWGSAGGRGERDPVPGQRRRGPRHGSQYPGRRRRGRGRMTAPNDHFSGQLFLRGDPGYEQARVGRVFNARRPPRYPGRRVAGRLPTTTWSPASGSPPTRGWPVSIRSGGHSWAAWSLHDDALLIDLGELRDLEYDDATGVVAAAPGGARRRGASALSSRRAVARFPAATAPPSGSAGSCSKAVRAGTADLGDGRARASSGSTWSPPTGRSCMPTSTRTPTCCGPRAAPVPGFPGLITRFYLQTYPAPVVMWQDTWTFRLELTPGSCWAGCTTSCPRSTPGSSRWWRRRGWRTCRSTPAWPARTGRSCCFTPR